MNGHQGSIVFYHFNVTCCLNFPRLVFVVEHKSLFQFFKSVTWNLSESNVVVRWVRFCWTVSQFSNNNFTKTAIFSCNLIISDDDAARTITSGRPHVAREKRVWDPCTREIKAWLPRFNCGCSKWKHFQTISVSNQDKLEVF